ncbi:hypothetical protein GIB67_020837 [Kingdonia uniflora]|uniref:65-kDa microtubule-associated protein 6 n=1 Tax=Kingdonia uniflora TaxID=39325 RepID=A0A7J7M7K1_9MAGN|nr:hypothetical protein GIB67_020837 [Kingdonia uniflora]
MGSLEFGSSHMDSSWNALIKELQHIWDEIGETEAEKGRMLIEIERECLQVYQRKIDEASNFKSHLHWSVAAKEAELATLMAALGERTLCSKRDKTVSLKTQLQTVTPLVQAMMTKKEERVKEFIDVKAQIDKISGEISGYISNVNDTAISCLDMEQQDLSLRKLNEYKTRLETLKKEKSDRHNKVLEYVNEVHSLCGVLGEEFSKNVSEVHPSLQKSSPEHCHNISNNTLEGLEQTVLRLKMERKARTQRLKDILLSLFDLWNLMDPSEDEKSRFQKIAAIVESPKLEITKFGVLSLTTIEQAAAEVERLTKLKAIRMKELVLKQRSELEEICRRAHIVPDMSTSFEKSNALIDSGLVNPSELLTSIEGHITKVIEEAMSRKEIMDRVDRWQAACEEETWLEDYNQDKNRYSAGRGVHINLKRAERARGTVNKIPAIVDNLMNRTLAWEDERKMEFLYDGVRLVSVLDEYKLSRYQRVEEKKRYRDHKKIKDLLLTERESIYGSKPSTPKRTNSMRKVNSYRVNENGTGSLTPVPRRHSGGDLFPELLTPRSHSGRQNGYLKEMRRFSSGPLNFVSLSKDDTMSYLSVCGSQSGSSTQDYP